ncbi:Nn.00g058750.m01.CDS01 [Neocucurbitaria sp. VM-36]
MASRTFQRCSTRKAASRPPAKHPADRPCSLPQEDLYTAIPQPLSVGDSSEVSSDLDINESSSGIPTPDQVDSPPERHRRKSSLVDVVKNLGNVASLFRRKDSVLDQESLSTVDAPNTPSPSTLDSLRGRNQVSLSRKDFGEMAYEGMAHFSNVSQFFSQRKAVGESSNWYATDEYLSWQNTSANTSTSTPVTNIEAGLGTSRWRNPRAYSSEPTSCQKQPSDISLLKNMLDIVFSWLSVRPSEKSRGKRPKSFDDLPSSLSGSLDVSSSKVPVRPATPKSTPSSAIHPLTTVAGVIPPTSTEDLTLALGQNTFEIPDASSSSSRSSIPSRTLLPASSPRPDDESSLPIPPELSGSYHLISLPHGPPCVRPYSSDESSGASSTSLSSLEDSHRRNQSTRSTHHAIPNSPASSSSNATGAQGRSLPVDIPAPNNILQDSSTPSRVVPARPNQHHYLCMRTVSQILESLESTTTCLDWQHNDNCNDFDNDFDNATTAPLSPYIGPTRFSAAEPTMQMQALTLPPARRPFLTPSPPSNELIFRLSAPPSPSLSREPIAQPAFQTSRKTESSVSETECIPRDRNREQAQEDTPPALQLSHPAAATTEQSTIRLVRSSMESGARGEQGTRSVGSDETGGDVGQVGDVSVKLDEREGEVGESAGTEEELAMLSSAHGATPVWWGA